MRLTSPYIFISGLLLTSSAMISCSGHDNHDHDREAAELEDHDHEGESELTTVHLDSADIAMLGIVTAEIRPDTFLSATKVTAQILPSPTDCERIVAPVSGTVRLSEQTSVGNRVGRGATLATISQQNVSGTNADRLAAAEIAAAQKEYDRLKPLRAEGLVTVAELNAAEARLNAARAAASAGASGRVTAPTEGTLSEVMVTNGTFVNAGDPVAVITRGGNITLRIDLPQRLADAALKARSLRFRPAGSGRVFSVDSRDLRFSPATATTSGYIPLSASFPNPGLTSTGGFADVWLIGEPVDGVLSVPDQALTDDQGESFIYVEGELGHFERRLVRTGDSDGLRTRILSGLEPGERVAVAGAPMLRMAQAQSTPVEGHHHH
ncbi:MAG: efflux RND transporter periplasmic adaptor subunit [Clostridium sp.]|nr:efflux RND transporter periplasmic adaptor subunit [Clostridium sp.]